MYRYLSRTSVRRQMDLEKVARGNEIVWRNECARVPSSQAFSYLWDFRPFGSTNNSGTRDAQIQIINALRLGQRNRAHELLVDLSCMSNSSNVEDFDYILEYCARTPDPLFVMEAWKVMVKNEINMKKKSYRCIIQAFSKGGYFKEIHCRIPSPMSSVNSSVREGSRQHAQVYCYCHLKCVVYTCYRGPNRGRQFYRCIHGRTNDDCNFFKWIDEFEEPSNDTHYATEGTDDRILKKLDLLIFQMKLFIAVVAIDIIIRMYFG